MPLSSDELSPSALTNFSLSFLSPFSLSLLFPPLPLFLDAFKQHTKNTKQHSRRQAFALRDRRRRRRRCCRCSRRRLLLQEAARCLQQQLLWRRPRPPAARDPGLVALHGRGRRARLRDRRRCRPRARERRGNQRASPYGPACLGRRVGKRCRCRGDRCRRCCCCCFARGQQRRRRRISFFWTDPGMLSDPPRTQERRKKILCRFSVFTGRGDGGSGSSCCGSGRRWRSSLLPPCELEAGDFRCRSCCC